MKMYLKNSAARYRKATKKAEKKNETRRRDTEVCSSFEAFQALVEFFPEIIHADIDIEHPGYSCCRTHRMQLLILINIFSFFCIRVSSVVVQNLTVSFLLNVRDVRITR
jgi:hypothetical protein